MASTYTNNGIELITSGEQSGTWGTTSNTNWTSMEAMVTGYVDYTVTNASTRTETIADGAADDFRNKIIKMSGTLSQAQTITIADTSVEKEFWIYNGTTGGYAVTFKQGTGANTITINNGNWGHFFVNGANDAEFFTPEQFTTISVTTAVNPDTSGGADLGTSSLEWGDVYIADNKFVNFGSDQDVLVGWNTTRTGLDVSATEGAALALYLSADQGDDAGDEWKLNIADGGTITLGSDINSAGTFVTHLTITPNSTVASSTVAFAGNITIAGTVNSTGTITGTLATAAQGNVTSLGTLTALTVDNIAINGTTIGHTGDTDLMTLASGILTVAGEISVTTLDIGGTNVTSTAAELNLLDGSSAGSIVDGKAPIYASNGVLNATTLQIASSSINATATEINTCCDGNTSATGVTLADADRVVVNDGGTMKQVALTDFETYFESVLDTLSNVTSLGTLTTLTVDNVIINGTTIGHTGDTDLLTLASGELTVAGNIGITDDLSIKFGAAPDYLLYYDEAGQDSLTVSAYVEGAALKMDFHADQADDNADKWRLQIADAGVMTWESLISGSFVAHTTLTPNSTVASSTMAFAGNVTVAGTINSTGTITGTLATAAQGNVTSLGTLTALTIDNVAINGTTIGHTSDTDLMTLASGVLTVAGEISVTTLDIGGTNVTSTAAELNLIDGSSANSVVNSKAVIYGSSGELAGTLSTAAQTNVTSLGTLTALTVDDVAINGDTITFQDGETITRAATDQMFFKMNGDTSGGKWQFNMGASNNNVLSMGQTGDGVGGTVFNEDGLDRDFRIETNDNANALVIDGGTNFMGFGAAASTSVNYFIARSKAYTAATNGDEYIAYIQSNSTAITTAGSGTHGVIATLGINEPDITIGTAGVTNAVTLLVNNVAPEATNNYALWINSGVSRFDGEVHLDTSSFSAVKWKGGQSLGDNPGATQQFHFRQNNSTSNGDWHFFLGASHYSAMRLHQSGDGTGNTIFNEDGIDRDFRVETDDETHCLMVDGGLNNVAMCTSSPSYGGGDGIIMIGNANTNPDSNPSGGGVLYVDSGALKYRGSSGTTTTLGAA